MPPYANSPQTPVRLLQKGVPEYLIGSFNYKVGNTKLGLLTNAIDTDVATVTGTLTEGPLPKVGDYISIWNSANSSGGFNVTRALITDVSYVASTNIMTLSFALTAADQAATADVGSIETEPAEVGETISGDYTSWPVVVQAPEGDSQFTIPLAVNVGSGITALTATLQVAVKDQPGEYTNTTDVVTYAASAYSSGPVVEATLQRGYLYRVAVTGVTGSGAVVAKIG